MNARDKKEIAARLQKSDRKLWKALSENERDLAIEKYDALTDPTKLSTTDLIDSVWNRADGVMLLVMGVIMGISGGLAATVLDRHFSKHGTLYEILVVLIFAAAVFGFSKLADLVVTVGYRRGKLLDRLIDKDNK